MKKKLTMMIVFLVCLSSACTFAFAANTLTVEDQAGLLTEAQAAALQEDYAELTNYMDGAVVTVATYQGETSQVAEDYAIQHYGNDAAVVFMIDMYNREIYVYANGDALKTISKADARAITDNIYKDASRGDYYACICKALDQILGKCQGQRLARPVKHITNAMIAILLGILINYLIAVSSRRARYERRTRGSVSVNASRRAPILPGIGLAGAVLLSSMRVYHESSSSSGGGIGGGGGFGGGGGHVGGGGGHSF